MDIIHAYKTAFTTANGAIGNSPVLVFEDDAVFTKTGKEDIAAVDRFVATSRFSIYSLGSLSLMIPCAGGHWALGGPFGAAHAAIYAGHARSAVIDAKPGKYAQIDASIMAHIPAQMCGALHATAEFEILCSALLLALSWSSLVSVPRVDGTLYILYRRSQC